MSECDLCVIMYHSVICLHALLHVFLGDIITAVAGKTVCSAARSVVQFLAPLGKCQNLPEEFPKVLVSLEELLCSGVAPQ